MPARRERHPMPPFVAEALDGADLVDAYEARPPYQRNDYLGWITTAKREATQHRRLDQMLDELRAGDVYMKMPWRGGRATDASESPTPEGDEPQPRLLSGGNPQIPKGDGDAPVQAYIAAMPGWKRDVGRALDALVVRIVPHVRKAIRWNTPFYGVDGQGWFMAYHCFDEYLKVTFTNGGALDPLPPVASKQPAVRYVHIHEHDGLDEAQFAQWIAQAAELPGEPLF